MLAKSFLGPIASRCMLLSPSSRGEQDQTVERRKSSLIHSLPDKNWVLVQQVPPFTIKLLCKRWFPPFSASLFQAFRSRGDSAKRCEEKKKHRGGGAPVFLLVFFSLFSFAPHSTIRTLGTSYFSTKSHRNACYTGYKKRRFWGRGNGYKMFHLKTGSHFTIMYCENNRENSQSKLVI